VKKSFFDLTNTIELLFIASLTQITLNMKLIQQSHLRFVGQIWRTKIKYSKSG